MVFRVHESCERSRSPQIVLHEYTAARRSIRLFDARHIYIYIYIPAYCSYIPPVIQIRVLTSLPTKQQKSKAAKQRNSKTAKQHNCKTLKQQISSSAAQQHSKTTKQQNSKSAKLQNSKSANQQLNSKTAKWQHSKTGTPEGGNLVSKHVL